MKSLQGRKRRRYRFSDDITGRVKRMCRLDNWHGPMGVLQIYALIAITIWMPYALEPYFGWWTGYFAAVIVIGFWQRALATCLHESSHKTLAQNKVWNYFLGTIGSGYLILQSWSPYYRTHVSLHHGWLGDEGRDVDTAYHVREGLYDHQSRAAFVWRNLIAPLFLIKTPSKVLDLVTNRFVSKHEPCGETIGKLSYLGILVGGLIYFGFGVELILFWLVPLLTTFPVVNWYIELFEHFPLVKESDLDLYMSRNRWTGPILKLFTGQLNENYHQTHHLVPYCPFWRLPDVHKVLMDDENYAKTQTRELGLIWPLLRGTPSIILSIVMRVARRQQRENRS